MILLQYAMQLEADPILLELKAREISPLHPSFPFKVYESDALGGTRLIITVAGKDPRHGVDSIGSVPAALQAHLAIEKFKPQLLINAGTAGGYQKYGAKIGDVYLGDKHVAFHDRRIQIPGFEKYGTGHFPVTDPTAFGIKADLPRAIVSTGDSLDCHDVDQKHIDQNQAELKEMEAAAIGYVCSLTGTPLLPIKAVTDWVDHPEPTGEQFFQNYQLTVKHLTAAVMGVLREIRLP